MPVSVAVIIVVMATVAIATSPNSFGASKCPRMSVPTRYSSFEIPSCIPFHKSALPARFSSLIR